ncbi:MAG TPA: hypothetical protein VGN95_22050 [Pyrinomonadaceae bacterium]|jgi:hypothetical protein|nr:hypothetical protein [Pyrinomonadaceae bacterium]
MVFFEFSTLLLYAFTSVIVGVRFVGALAKLIAEAVAAREIVVKKKGNN